ncbi:MAG TPA: hypothetical protein VFY29_13235 [Terriglobia bacterium]|nr:hypothetical protein [Terriglobia bacterium]
MKRLLGAALLAALISTEPTAFGQISFGIQIGRPPANRVQVRPQRPGRSHVWIGGYWYPNNRHVYRWRPGYWAVPPFEGAYWVAPRYNGNRYYYGYWAGGERHHRRYHRNRR